MNKLAKEVKSLLKDVDYYSQGVSLQLKHSEKFSTPLGQALSIAVLFFTLVSFGLLTNDLYAFNSPNIVSKVYSDVNPEAYHLDPSTFYIAIGVAAFTGFPIVNTEEKKYFNADFKFCDSTTTIRNGSIQSIGECYSINLIPCNQAHLDERYVQVINYFGKEGFSKDRYLQALCLDPEDWKSKSNISFIAGTPQSQTVSLAVLEISPCNPATQTSNAYIKLDCASNEEIKSQMNKGYLSVAFADRLIDQSQPGDPYSYTSKTILTSYTLETETSVKVTLRHSYFNSIQNFFYFSPSQDSYHVLTAASQVSNMLPKTELQNIIQLSFFLDDKQELYTRNYRTFFDILGSIGGIHSFLKIFLGLFIVPIQKLAQNINLINEVFDFEFKNQLVTSQFTASNQVKPYQSTLRQDEMIKERIFQNKHKIKYNCYQLLLITLCAKDKRKVVNQGIYELQRQLDIANILIKLHEIEHLKKLLLTEKELNLFQYLPRRSLNPIDLQSSHQIVQYSQDVNSQQFVESPKNSFSNPQWKILTSFQHLVSSTETRDLRLLNMLDDRTKMILHEALQEELPVGLFSPKSSFELQRLNPKTQVQSE